MYKEKRVFYSNLYHSLTKPSDWSGENIYSGKLKMYEFNRAGQYEPFVYEAMNYPEWGKKYAPIDKSRMFQKYVLDPLNRILVPSGLPELTMSGAIQMSLF